MSSPQLYESRGLAVGRTELALDPAFSKVLPSDLAGARTKGLPVTEVDSMAGKLPSGMSALARYELATLASPLMDSPAPFLDPRPSDDGIDRGRTVGLAPGLVPKLLFLSIVGGLRA